MFPDRFGQSLFMESKLSDNKRDKLKDSEFGIPDKRAYPLNDKSHVEAAVRMFPHADDSDKKELAKRIISKAKEFNMDTSGWDSLNEYIQESVAHGALLKVNDFKYDKVYFGSPNKISSPMKLDRPLFVSPFPGIASIFAVRPQNLSELGITVPNGKRVNKGYDEWNPKYKDTILRQPLKEVHIRLEGLPDFKPVTMMRHGYVYEIDVSNLKDNIYRNPWMSPVFEFLIANVDSVEFSNMTEVNIKTHIYGSELPKRFTESFSFDEPIQESTYFMNGDTGEIINKSETPPDINIDGNTWFEIDELIVPLVRIINKRGFKTMYCCSGHTSAPTYYDNKIHESTMPEPYVMIKGRHDFEGMPNGWYVDDDFVDDMPPRTVLRYKLHNTTKSNNPTKYTQYIDTYKEILSAIQGLCKYFDKMEFIQESMLQDIKNGVNPNSKKLFFHISLDKDLNGKTFKPRIPSYLTKKSNNDSNGYKEDKTTPRVCFSPSIEGCLRAILSAEKNLDIVGERIYVYIPDKPISEYKVKTNKEIIKEKLVFDAKMTKEMWILEPVKLKLYGVIYVDQVKNIRQSETLEGDPIGKVDYKWHWAVSPKYVDGIIDWMDEKDKTETVQEAMVDVAFNNLRCKIADALGDKYKVSNIIHNSLNSAKDKFTVALSSNTSKFVNVVNDTTGVSVLGYLRNISMSHAFDRLMEFFTSPEFISESYLTYERLAEYDDISTYDTIFQKCKDICDELSYFEYKIKGYEPTSQTINDIWKLQTPEETHKLKSGICYDYTEYVVNELQKIKDLKFKYRSIFIDMIWLVGKNYQRTTHAFVCCECDDKYIYIDTPQPNGNPPTVFNKLSDLILHVVNNMLYDESIQMSKLSRCMVFDFTDVCIPYRCDWKKYIDLIYDEGIKIDNLIDKKNKMIKEEFYMSDFVRDPSILRMFQEAKDSDEDEKEEEIDENLDESSEDIVDDDSEEPTTFGSDTSDVQNEYNPKDVEALNNLIAAENDAMNDYFEAGKNTNDDVLTRLYADIGAEERFHAEQLLYAKSVLTGEKYEPRDPEVKKEYEELLEMGMDEETAMTTAVDRLNIMNGSDDDIDMEDIEDALSITEAMLYMNSEQLETMLMICESDKYDIDEFCDDIQTFTESYYIEGAVNVADNKQVKEFKAKQDPLFFIARAFKNLFKFVIQIVKSIKQSMRALTVKRRNIADFIQKNGIKGLFAKGVSLYFFDIKNPSSIDEAPLQYCDLLYRLTTAIAKEVNYNMEPINSGNIQRIQFKNIEQGLNIIKGITLTKTKIIVNDENEDQIAKIFFGYTKEKAGVVKEKENSFEVQHKSMNIYTEYEIISNFLEYCSKGSTKFVEYMEKLDSDVNSVKYKDKNKYNQVLESMKVVNKGYDIFLKALTHDMKVVMNMFNQMANETQAKDLEDNKSTEGSTTQQS